MAESFEMIIPAHPSIYAESVQERQITIMFATPSAGVTKDTGLLLLLPSIGIEPSSNGSRGIRETLADRYNVVTIMCDGFFGQQFMGGSKKPFFQFNLHAVKQLLTEEEYSQVTINGTVDYNKFIQIANRYDISIQGHEQMNETAYDFNDMGIMQAIDHLTAVLVTTEILKDNEFTFNAGNVVAYGEGHGAYLAYLCNAFAPRLFSQIIDYNGWVVPPYLTENRYLTYKQNKITTTILFDYLVKKLPIDSELVNLSQLYRRVANYSNIVSFHEVGVPGTPVLTKKSFCNSIRSCMFNEITTDLDVKGFEQMYHFIMSNLNVAQEAEKIEMNLPTQVIDTRMYQYTIDYSNYVPVLTRNTK